MITMLLFELLMQHGLWLLRASVQTPRSAADYDHQYLENSKHFHEFKTQQKECRRSSALPLRDCLRSSSEVALITERVDVLNVVAKSMDSAEIRAGLLDVVNALVFLHEKAGIIHNSLSAAAIFVTPDGRWKLGSFEHASRRSGDSPDVKDFVALLQFLTPLVDEETADEFDALKERLSDESIELRALLEDGSLQSPLFEITNFLEHIQLKSDEEKIDFFGNLTHKLSHATPESVAKRLIRLFLSRYVMLDERAHESFLLHLLSMNDILSEDLYRSYLIPEILRIFGVRDKAIRLALLRHFHLYCPHIDHTSCAGRILPELTLGMYDTDDVIVSASLRAMADLVPILGGECVTGAVHTKHFSDGTPKPLKGALAPSTAPSEASTPSRYVPTPSSTSASPDTSKRRSSKLTVEAEEVPKMEEDEWSSWGAQDAETVENDEQVANEETEERKSEEKVKIATARADPPSRPLSRRSEKSNIGSEFSLPQIKPPAEEEVDFFADMEPKFDSAPSLVDSLKSRALMEASTSYLDRQAGIPVKFTLFNSDKESSAETELEHQDTETNGTSVWEIRS
ncbi:hypothetical protein QR680_015429 [Steinernema hermaphroditum]|uniref:Protein kinase domain-containing protein n=1 Tax=Steinernema hermaphroditum TaxID=289476 RepID=A0AA39H8K2_9BILA|nr:hypothetical protein QR680_015429 [Steinernema hermaphroditum]